MRTHIQVNLFPRRILGGTYRSIGDKKVMDSKADWAEREKALAKLIGARLTSVQFVMDYLIFGFDERGALTTLVWPEIFDTNEKISFGMKEYRDALCGLIGKIVQNATIGADETISFVFDGSEVRIALRSYQLSGERAILTGPKHYLLVF
jgi:hypothetical protein